eukprot:scaffold1.g5649.t1
MDRICSAARLRAAHVTAAARSRPLRAARAGASSLLRQLKQFQAWASAPSASAAAGASAALGRSSAAAPAPRRAGAGAPGPRGAGGGRRAGLLWFRGDLRIHDNEALARATAECSGVLPVYCFDPRDYGRGRAGYERTGPYRATFLLQAVADLRRRLRDAGSELVVRLGRPEEVLPQLLQRLGPGLPGTAPRVYCHSGVTFEELQVEARVKQAVEAAGGQLACLWANTLHQLEDLPFKLEQLPQTFERFREATASVAPRAALPAPEQLRGVPLSAGRLDRGELPTLKDLGLAPLPAAVAACPGGDADPAPVGGEGEALRLLRAFMAEASGAGRRGGSGAAYGSNFSSSIAPWLATGCLSPRLVLDEAKRLLGGSSSAPTTAAAPAAAAASAGGATAAGGGGGGGALEWVQFELLWRDFFRFMTRRWSLMRLPASPGTGARSTRLAPAALAACA